MGLILSYMALTGAKWSKAQSGFGSDISVWSTVLHDLDDVLGLNKVDLADPLHARMSRARYPNKDPTTTMEHGLLGSQGALWLKPPGWSKPGFNVSRTVWMESPSSDEAAGSSGEHFTYGVGGWSCGRYNQTKK